MADQGPTGITRIIRATGYSFKGLKAAYQHEAAFRQETWLAAILIPLGFYMAYSPVEQALMVGVVLLVLITELLNSAIEAIVDRVGTEHHDLSGRAKDIGSAAVFVSLTCVVVTWGCILIPRYLPV